jgi:hypothetical protein
LAGDDRDKRAPGVPRSLRKGSGRSKSISGAKTERDKAHSNAILANECLGNTLGDLIAAAKRSRPNRYNL